MFTKSAADITFSDIEEFCREFGEGVRVEYKQEIQHVPKIVSSFANTLGGIFIIGVQANDENKVIFPIQGIPMRGGIREQILQSALTGIYPAVIPEVEICPVPGSDNVVVIVRVNENVQAPHAIQNSTRVYIRTGSITQPYELAEIEQIEYMLKRREDSQQVTRQILDRTEERIESLFETNEPNLTAIARPVFPYRPLISLEEIGNFATEEGVGYDSFSTLGGGFIPAKGKRVAGGSIAVTGRNRALYNYWEFNEYGIVYHRRALQKVTSKFADGDEEEHLQFQEFALTIGKLIQRAKSFYKKCGYLGNIEIAAQLRRVFDEKLRFYELYNDYSHQGGSGHIDVDYIGQQQSSDSEVLASAQRLPRNLAEKEIFIDVVDMLAGQLLWAFNIGDPMRNTATKRRQLIERILKTASLIV